MVWDCQFACGDGLVIGEDRLETDRGSFLFNACLVAVVYEC